MVARVRSAHGPLKETDYRLSLMVVITGNVLNRVSRIRHGMSGGTGLTVDVGNRQYLVTAKHVISGAVGRIDLRLGTSQGWTAISGSVVGHGDGDVDVSALALERLLTTPTMTLPVSSGHLSHGQDVYFLGFPHGFIGKVILGPEGYPLPFVKKACLSQWVDKLE